MERRGAELRQSNLKTFFSEISATVVTALVTVMKIEAYVLQICRRNCHGFVTNGKRVKSNPSLFKKAAKILMDIMQHPRTWLGHPEALIGGNDITYSRHITAHDRIIYDIYDDCVSVLVVQAEEHYNDK